MLESLRFKDYRCFRDHRLPLKPETIVVGKNNSGKSTAIEGFRLVSLVTERFPNLIFQDVPRWLSIARRNRGARVDFSGLGLNWGNLFHRYQDPPASIEARFDSGYSIEIHLGPDGASHTVLKKPNGVPITSRTEANQHRIPRVSVLPQVAPLEREESVLVPDYVRANLSSYLAPRHFRNQLKLLYQSQFKPFKALVEATWPGLQIIEFRGPNRQVGQELSLLVRDGDFVAEVASMGHGLQMWLQTIWFISRTSRNDTVVLDEPDVYMHPDLQRRLIRHIRTTRPQVVIATHSTEILSETEASHVLVINKGTREAAFSTSLPSVQRILDSIGSAQNIHLTRLWTSRKLLLVEGKDIKLLTTFHEKLFPESEFSLETIPNMSIGGWNGWPYAVGSAMLLRNSGGEDITTYCVLDSDFFTEGEKQHRHEQATERNVQLHIWRKKEIENYLLVAQPVQRLIGGRIDNPARTPDINTIEQVLDRIADELRDPTVDALAQQYYNQERALGLASANQKARQRVDAAWTTREGRLGVISGKEAFSQLAAWSQDNFSVSFGTLSVAQQFRAVEIPDEIGQVIRLVQLGQRFDGH